jgi:hypothetical protein
MRLADDYAWHSSRFNMATNYGGPVAVEFDIDVQRARADLQMAIESLQKRLTAPNERVE